MISWVISPINVQFREAAFFSSKTKINIFGHFFEKSTPCTISYDKGKPGKKYIKKFSMAPPGFEPGIFCGDLLR